MPPADFENSVFVNCPFDDEYAPLLQAVLFCIVDLGFVPRIASERAGSAELRLQKIRMLIEACRYSIHDLSRAQANRAGEFYRLNMPFELGFDYACRCYCGGGRETNQILILEEQPHRYQAALSDLAGCDIKVHRSDHQTAIRQVRNWLVSEAKISADGAARIASRYEDFQGWHYDRQLGLGFSEEDIRDYPTSELLDSIWDWIEAGRPAVLT